MLSVQTPSCPRLGRAGRGLSPASRSLGGSDVNTVQLGICNPERKRRPFLRGGFSEGDLDPGGRPRRNPAGTVHPPLTSAVTPRPGGHQRENADSLGLAWDHRKSQRSLPGRSGLVLAPAWAPWVSTSAWTFPGSAPSSTCRWRLTPPPLSPATGPRTLATEKGTTKSDVTVGQAGWLCLY